MSFHYFLTPIGRSGGAEPVIPLPNVGEGGPVYPGDDPAAEPVIPLPFPGEGGPVYPGDDSANEPVIPLPGPGEGGPVYPGPGTSTGSRTSRARFLNAAYDYPALRISVSGSRFVNRLGYASVTSYGRFPAGYQTVTVAGTGGRVYLRKSLPFQSGGLTTVAVIRTARGLDLLQVEDRCCPPATGCAAFRVGNLAYNADPLDVIMSDGRVVWSDLRFKEVPAFKRIMPGTYQFFYADTNLSAMPANLDIETLDSAWLGVYPPHETFGSLYLDVTSNAIYSVYLLQSGSNRNNIQNLILMDR